MANPLLQPSPYDADGGELVGRDPRELNAAEYLEHFPGAPVGLKAIRAKCLDCCGEIASEVRKCTAMGCPLWPLRMGSVPRGLSEARGNKGRSKQEAA